MTNMYHRRCLAIRQIRRWLLATVAIGIAMTIAFTATATPTERDGELVADGSWCWFQDPRAVHHVGAHDRTYVGYVTSRGDIDIISQDNGTAALTHTTLHPRLIADDHAAPGLVVLPNGKIAVFYATHGGDHYMRYRVSTTPENITTFGPERTLNLGRPVTYANPIYLPAEQRLFLFYRGTSTPWMTSTADLTGLTGWTTPRQVITPRATHTAVSALTRPYVKYATNDRDEIAVLFTDGHPQGDTENGLPTSTYEITYKAGAFWTPAGTNLGAGPIHIDDLRASHPDTVVYDDPGGSPSWIESTAIDPATGDLVALYSTYRDAAWVASPHTDQPVDATYRYARWDGTAWASQPVAPAGASIDTHEGYYSGGGDIDRTDTRTLYLSQQTGTATWDVERWRSAGGAFTSSKVTQNTGAKNVRPIVPWGPAGEIKTLWMSGTYDHWASGYHTQIRELTTGVPPTTARISAPTSSRVGYPLSIQVRVVQGYLGTPLPYATAVLLGHEAGQPDRVIRRGVTDANGLIGWTVYPTATMRFTGYHPLTNTWGASYSPSVVVTVTR